MKTSELYVIFSRLYEDGYFQKPYTPKLECYDVFVEKYCLDLISGSSIDVSDVFDLLYSLHKKLKG